MKRKMGQGWGRRHGSLREGSTSSKESLRPMCISGAKSKAAVGTGRRVTAWRGRGVRKPQGLDQWVA